MHIHGYSQLTLLDFPGRIGCTVFTGHCNFRCPFCHNASLVLRASQQPELDPEKVLTHIASRANRLEGVCVTGGEPTLQKDLPEFLRRLKDLGLLVKLDTNGTNPDLLTEVVTTGLVDFVAMDIKAGPDNYGRAAGLADISMDRIFRSAEFLLSGQVDYEFRTTVVEGIHTDTDFRQIGSWLTDARSYYLQQYKDSGDLISPEGLAAPTREQLTHYCDIVRPFIPSVAIHGVD